MDVAGMMYTKEGEFEVSLTGGSPWGFTIRTQSGNGSYKRGKVIVAKVCTFENMNQYNMFDLEWFLLVVYKVLEILNQNLIPMVLCSA
jgi:hypothetical protein